MCGGGRGVGTRGLRMLSCSTAGLCHLVGLELDGPSLLLGAIIVLSCAIAVAICRADRTFGMFAVAMFASLGVMLFKELPPSRPPPPPPLTSPPPSLPMDPAACEMGWMPPASTYGISAKAACAAQHKDWRSAFGALREVDEIFSATYKTPSFTPPMEIPALHTVAARCCQVYPFETGMNFEHLRRPAFIFMNLRDSIVNHFLNNGFPRLVARNISFTLMLAGDDQSAPWEMFYCQRSRIRMRDANGTNLRGADALRHFIGSPLLKHLYTQNYDLLPHENKRIHFAPCADRVALGTGPHEGHNPLDSTLGWGQHAGDEALLRKVSPIPIGLRLTVARSATKHILPFPGPYSAPNRTEKWTDCRKNDGGELRSLRHARAAAPCFARKKDRILITFRADPRKDRRQQAYRHLTSPGMPVTLASKKTELSVEALYRKIGEYKFVAAPASHGQDTMRFWETLYMGSIPVLLSGPLDVMYGSMPCVLVDSWESIMPDDLADWERRLIRRFGPSPVANPAVQRRLTSSFWAESIQSGEPTWFASGPMQKMYGRRS